MRPLPTIFPTRLLIRSLMLSALAAVVAMPAAQAGDALTIYRCTDAKGRLALRDSPCLKGERQETRSMLRPKDAPSRSSQPMPAPPSVATAAPPPQVIVVHPPRPLYECAAPDNERYLSDSPEGNLRWVPLWTQGYPVLAEVPVYQPGQLDIRVDNGRVGGSYRSGSLGTALVPTLAGQGAGAWIRDPCRALPQIEICERLRGRRDALRQRFTIAQPSERALLGSEERSINARLGQDCR